MVTQFEAAMAKMALLGQDASTLVDCSDVIPTPQAAAASVATLPAGKTMDDVETSCAETPFPTLSAASGVFSIFIFEQFNERLISIYVRSQVLRHPLLLCKLYIACSCLAELALTSLYQFLMIRIINMRIYSGLLSPTTRRSFRYRRNI